MRTHRNSAGIFFGVRLSMATVSCTSPTPDALSAGDAQTIRDTVIALDHAMNHAVDNLDCAKGMSYIATQPPVLISNGHVVLTKPELLQGCRQMVAPRTGAEFAPDSVTPDTTGAARK